MFCCSQGNSSSLSFLGVVSAVEECILGEALLKRMLVRQWANMRVCWRSTSSSWTGEWKYAPDMPAMHDERNIINNVVEVQEYVPDHLDSLVGFEPPALAPRKVGAFTTIYVRPKLLVSQVLEALLLPLMVVWPLMKRPFIL